MVRIALGATSRRIAGLVVASGLRVILIGVGAGVLVALAAGRVMASLRAMRVDPMRALASE